MAMAADGLDDLFGLPTVTSSNVSLGPPAGFDDFNPHGGPPAGNNLLDFDGFNPNGGSPPAKRASADPLDDFRCPTSGGPPASSASDDFNPNGGQSAPHERRAAATSAPGAIDPDELRRRISGQSGGEEKSGVIARLKAMVVGLGSKVIALRPSSLPDFRSMSRCSSRSDDSDDSKLSRCGPLRDRLGCCGDGGPLRDRFAANPKIGGFAMVAVLCLIAGGYAYSRANPSGAVGAEFSDEAVVSSEFVEVSVDNDEDDPPVRTIDDPTTLTTTRAPKKQHKQKKDRAPASSEAGGERGREESNAPETSSNDIASLRRTIEDGNKGLREEISALREEVAMLRGSARSGEGRPERPDRRTSSEPETPAFRGSEGRQQSSQDDNRSVPRMEDASRGRPQRSPDDAGDRGAPRREGSDSSRRDSYGEDGANARPRSNTNAGEVRSENPVGRPAFERGQTQRQEPNQGVGEVHFPA